MPSRRRRVRHWFSRLGVPLRYYLYGSEGNPLAALPVERRVLARLGLVGETADLFEQSLLLLWC